MDEAYKKQVGLLLDVLPEVAKEECFAMHGGTAINLFVRDMPRLQLIETAKASWSEEDKGFLLSLNRLAPGWSNYDYQRFPSVNWKLRNLEKFKNDNPEAYQQQLQGLESVLEQ